MCIPISNTDHTSFFCLFRKRTKRAKSKLELSAVRVLALGVVRRIVRKILQKNALLLVVSET